MTEFRDEHDDLARLYDLDLTEDPGDVDLYLSLACRTGGPILELAVGSGRIAVPLVMVGHDVTGVDTDPAMLNRARQRVATGDASAGDRLTLVEGDLRTVRLSDAGSYRLALIALNSILLLSSRDDQREALRTLAHHLAPGGLAVVDVWLPDADDLGRFDGRIVLEYARPDPASGRMVTKSASAQHDATAQRVVLTAIYEESSPGEPARRWVRTDRLRLVTADELAGFAEDAGLVVEQLAGGYDLSPLGPGSDRAILIAAKP
jgi:SAM-dependent methyltransferase